MPSSARSPLRAFLFSHHLFYRCSRRGWAAPLVAVLMLLPVGALASEQADAARDASSVTRTIDELTVYASPGCGCCAEWAERLEEEGVATDVQRVPDMETVKQKYGIEPQHRSCHTSVSADGYVFEGHIPLRYIREFLADPPDGAVGLTVPGMPLGSPGMEMNGQFTPYNVLLLEEDGSTEVFARVDSPADQ